MMKIVEWIFPLRTISEANTREHRYSKAKKKRRADQKYFINWAFVQDIVQKKKELPPQIFVHLTRIAPRSLDYDNLVSSFKHIRDYLASCVHPEAIVVAKMKNGKTYTNPGHCDKGNSIKWDYSQEKGKPLEYAVKIEIFDPMPIYEPRND